MLTNEELGMLCSAGPRGAAVTVNRTLIYATRSARSLCLRIVESTSGSELVKFVAARHDSARHGYRRSLLFPDLCRG